MMKMSRRTAVGAAIAAVGVAAVGGYHIIGPLNDPEGEIANFIARHVPGVSATDAAATAFAADAAPYLRQKHNHFEAHLALIKNPLIAGVLPAHEAWAQDEFERGLITRFMRSTDYLLRSGADEPVSYVAFADPYAVGCSNPLANLA